MARRAGGGKYCVEGCRFVDALDLRRKGYLQPPAPGKPPYAVTATCGGREQSIATVWTPCRFGGGKRPWFQCGYCARRVLRLYSIEDVFACRHCHRLGYESQLETPHERGSGRAQKIRRRLDKGADDPMEFPGRPRGMHRQTYERWRQTHDDAEERSVMGLMNFVERLGRRA